MIFWLARSICNYSLVGKVARKRVFVSRSYHISIYPRINSKSNMSLFHPDIKYQVQAGIKLTENEQRIKQLLDDFTDYYNSKNPAVVDDESNANNNSNEPLTLRITGGWVRDKLLGKESHDIDIAINKLSGENFAIQLNEYILQSEKYSKQLTTSSIHKIDKNPEKSKHLETTTTKLYDESIDFVNLRNEEYTNVNSRIPTIVEFGTAEQDALRRDATLNAIFYNLTTNQIEDFTGAGLNDLKHGVLRTPLEPLKTFLDDPLRVLRLIRFASQFGFKIDQHTLEIMKSSEEIKFHLLRKVSKERIGIELAKTLMSSYPLVGLNLINEVGLYAVILSLPDESLHDQYLESFFKNQFPLNFKQDIQKLDAIYTYFSNKHQLTLLEQDFLNILTLDKKSQTQKNYQKLFFLILIFKNACKEFPQPDYQFQIKKKKYFPIEFIIKESLRFNKTEADLVNKVLIQEQNNTVTFNHPHVLSQRSIIGVNVIRNFKSSEYWRLSLILKYFETYNVDKQANQHYADVYEFVIRENLGSAFNDKLIIDGKQLTKIINKKPGPWLSSVNNLIFKWQLDHPTSDNLEDVKKACIDFIQTDEEVQKLIG